MTWALGIGRYGGPDEPAHVLRSFAAAHGNVLGDPAATLPPGYRVVSAPAGLASGDPACYRHDARVTSQCAAVDPGAVGATSPAEPVRVATSAGLTPPLYHLAVGSLVRLIGDPANMFWYRAMAALLHAFVVALTLTRLRRRPIELVAAAAIVTPATWFLLGVVNPNSLEIALALLAWVGVARFVETDAPTDGDVWWIAVPAALAIAVRPIAIAMVVAMALTIELRGRAPHRERRRRVALALPVVLAIGANAIWNAVVDVQLDDPRTTVHRSFLANLGDAFGSLHITATEAVTSLGWNEFHAPLLATLVWIVVWSSALVATVGVIRRSSRRHRLAAAGWVTVLVATPVAFEVLLAGSVGPIWQGRYSLPVLVGLPLFVHLPRPDRAAASAVLIVAALAETATYWATVRRYAVGSHGSWFLHGGYDSSALLEPRTWLVVHVAVVVLLVPLAVRSMHGPRPAPTAGQAM